METEELFTGLREEEKELFRSEERNGYLLRLEEGHPKNKVFVLIGTEINVGRSPVNEVTIDDGMVSDKHFKIKILRGQTPFLEDLGSTNGTNVNQKKIKNVVLKDGDEIHIGVTKLRFRLDVEKS
jgi:pSer/pThr/pTyr-binding forkhead associated (FHA) protein